MAAIAAFLPAMISAGGSIAGLMGGSPTGNVSSGQNPLQMAGQLFQPAMSMGLGQVSNAPNIYGGTLGQYGGIAQGLVNNPGAAGMLQGAQNASQMGAGAANNAYGLGNFLTGIGSSLMPYATQILDQGFDPQRQLYDRTQLQLQEQTRAGQAARGLGTSPFGAGLENKAMSDFNIDWQNNLLGRMNTAAQGASGLVGRGTDTIGQGVGMMGAAPGLMQQTSMFPYMANQQIGQNQLGALGQYGAQGMLATAQPQQQLQDFFQLAGLGNAGSGVMNNMFGNQLNQQNAAFGQNQQMGANLGNSLSQLGKSFGGSSGGMGSSGGNSFWPSASFMSGGMGWG